MKKLKHILLPVLCAAATFLASCAADSSLTSVSGGYVLIDGEKTVPEYVMELDGEKLGFDRYRYLFLNTADAMTEGIEDEKLAAFWTDENAASLKKQVETYAANEHAILKYAAEKGIKLNDAEQKEVDSFVESVIDTNGMDQFSKSLNTLYLTKPLYRSLQEEERLFQKLYDHLFGEGGELALTEDGYKEYYLANYLRAVQIKVDFEVGENRENCPETLKKAQEIRDEAAAGDFENTARARNAVLTGKTDPAGFSFSENDVASEFWQAASLLKEGEISQPVVTDQGVHVIKRLAPDESDMASRRDEILWGKTLADGSFTGGVYPELFEKFYTDLGKQYLDKIVYNPQIEAYLKPGLVF